MNQPTQPQIITTLGPILGFIAGYFGAWWGIDQATALSIVTAIATVAYTVYAAIATRPTALTTTVANMPEVKEIVLDKRSPSAISIEENTPENVTAK